jgi:hypothetical protein
MFAAEEEDGETDRIPKPAIPAPRSVDHPQTYPARRPPTVEPAHQAMIATANEFQHCLGKHRHVGISRPNT